MPKPMLKQQSNPLSDSKNLLRAHPQEQLITQMNKMEMDRLLRKKRSKGYIEAIHKLDAGGHVKNQNQVDEILRSIKDEFEEVEISKIMLGIVAICRLGTPYEVHTLDISGKIIEHYKYGESLKGGLEKARSLALRGGYCFVEVYTDCCRCVSSTGAVSVVNL